MTATAPALNREAEAATPWLHSRNWDLTFITLNVLLVTVPYLSYIALLQMERLLGPIATTFGTDIDNISRNIINATVALLIGGPHMYATFSRTALDRDYVKKHPRVIWTSLAIPVIVVSLALFNLQLLLTVFFFWASVHVLHQIIFITEMYNQKQRTRLTVFARVARPMPQTTRSGLCSRTRSSCCSTCCPSMTRVPSGSSANSSAIWSRFR